MYRFLHECIFSSLELHTYLKAELLTHTWLQHLKSYFSEVLYYFRLLSASIRGQQPLRRSLHQHLSSACRHLISAVLIRGVKLYLTARSFHLHFLDVSSLKSQLHIVIFFPLGGKVSLCTTGWPWVPPPSLVHQDDWVVIHFLITHC